MGVVYDGCGQVHVRFWSNDLYCSEPQAVSVVWSLESFSSRKLVAIGALLIVVRFS